MQAIAEEYLAKCNTNAAAQLFRTLALNSGAGKAEVDRFSIMAAYCDVVTDFDRFPQKRFQSLIVEVVLDSRFPPAALFFGYLSEFSPKDAEEAAATLAPLSKAHKRLLLAVHPDKNSHPSAAEAVSRLLRLKEQLAEEHGMSTPASPLEPASPSSPKGFSGSVFYAEDSSVPYPTVEQSRASPKSSSSKLKSPIHARSVKGATKQKKSNVAVSQRSKLDSLLSTLRGGASVKMKLSCDLSVEGVTGSQPTSTTQEEDALSGTTSPVEEEILKAYDHYERSHGTCDAEREKRVSSLASSLKAKTLANTYSSSGPDRPSMLGSQPTIQLPSLRGRGAATLPARRSFEVASPLTDSRGHPTVLVHRNGDEEIVLVNIKSVTTTTRRMS